MNFEVKDEAGFYCDTTFYAPFLLPGTSQHQKSRLKGGLKSKM